MNKTEIKNSLEKQYSSFTAYLRGLSDNDFMYTHESKWSAGQHLKHIVLCVSPLVRVFEMPASLIEENFGTTDTQSRTYSNMVADYQGNLKQGGKAPKRYIPETVSENEKFELLETLSKLIEKLNTEIDQFSEKELDKLCIPHPLLGSISLREMLFNTIYHVEHHKKQIENNLS